MIVSTFIDHIFEIDWDIWKISDVNKSLIALWTSQNPWGHIWYMCYFASPDPNFIPVIKVLMMWAPLN
jgi:hypothetical protein